MAPRKKPADDAALKAKVLDAALMHAVFDGFSDKLLARAGEESGAGKPDLARLFPNGPLSLVEAFSEAADAGMEKSLAAMDLKAMKIRQRIAAAVMAEQVAELHRLGFDQFHFYTLNQSDLTYAACRLLGMRAKEVQ